jgi:hypothetical protein
MSLLTKDIRKKTRGKLIVFGNRGNHSAVMSTRCDNRQNQSDGEKNSHMCGYHLVVGKRFHGGILPGVVLPLHRA